MVLVSLLVLVLVLVVDLMVSIGMISNIKKVSENVFVNCFHEIF